MENKFKWLAEDAAFKSRLTTVDMLYEVLDASMVSTLAEKEIVRLNEFFTKNPKYEDQIYMAQQKAKQLVQEAEIKKLDTLDVPTPKSKSGRKNKGEKEEGSSDNKSPREKKKPKKRVRKMTYASRTPRNASEDTGRNMTAVSPRILEQNEEDET